MTDKPDLSPPVNLQEQTWVEFELSAALGLSGALAFELTKLKHRVNKERVHKSRVALRRWFSVWTVLSEDGWSKKKFRQGVIKPLRKLLKKLGSVRDIDVNIELARKLGCEKALIKHLARKRRKARKKLEKLIKTTDLQAVTAGIHDYLSKTAKNLHTETVDAAYEHFDRYITRLEERVKRMAQTAKSPEDLHQLRLVIKQWRYLLVECFGLSNNELVISQQYLGDIHDLDSFRQILIKLDEQSPALARLKTRRQELMARFKSESQKLPYGLRPGFRSFKELNS
ncbi:MAG: CHAD domain-containing protein [Candidatus Obscuribacterales bacterium]|nr:CHAD domain-containing protein [Candidatus Obscuribacterales bacterium]